MIGREIINLLPSAFWGYIMSILGGVISGAIFGLIFWFIYFVDFNELLSDPFLFILTLLGTVFGTGFTVGLPIGIIVGTTACFHFFFFRHFRPNLYIFLFLITASIIAGGWLSEFDTNILFFAEISFVGIVSSLFSHKFSLSKKDVITGTSVFVNIACSINVAIIIFLFIYRYFALWKYYVDTTSF